MVSIWATFGRVANGILRRRYLASHTHNRHARTEVTVRGQPHWRRRNWLKPYRGATLSPWSRDSRNLSNGAHAARLDVVSTQTVDTVEYVYNVYNDIYMDMYVTIVPT